MPPFAAPAAVKCSQSSIGRDKLPCESVPRNVLVATTIAVVQTTPMKASNKTIAIDYLDTEIAGCGISGVLKRVGNALKQKDTSTLEFNVVALKIDARALTVALLQDWGACEPETFSVEEFIGLVETSRRRYRK